MTIKIEREPSILYETVELLYACINHIEPEYLTMVGSYCIPAPQVKEIIDQVGSGLDSSNPELQLYFRKRPIQGQQAHDTCLAFCMTYCFMVFDTVDMQEQMNEMCEKWEEIRKSGFTIRGIGRCSLDISTQPNDPPPVLAQELKKLPIEQDFLLALLDCFSGFSYHMERLYTILQPTAQQLRQLLEPYVQRCESLREAWKDFFLHHTAEEFVKMRMGITPEHPFTEVDIVLRYLDSSHAPGQMDTTRNTLGLHSGIGVQPTLEPAYQKGRLTEREFAAFRLLGNKGRSQIIQALAHRFLPMQELATEMNMNPGMAFRDLNSLANAGLLIREVRDGRCYYQTNLPYLDAIFQHVLTFYQDGEAIQPE